MNQAVAARLSAGLCARQAAAVSGNTFYFVDQTVRTLSVQIFKKLLDSSSKIDSSQASVHCLLARLMALMHDIRMRDAQKAVRAIPNVKVVQYNVT